MFICQNCLSKISANQPSFNYTIQKRTKIYPKRLKANVFIDEKGKEKKSDDPGGQGFEIVKQIRVCKKCYEVLMSN